MAEATTTTGNADGGLTYKTATLVSGTATTGATNHIDTRGYVSKLLLEVHNGGADTADVKVQGSFDLTNWIDIPYTFYEGSTVGTEKNTAETIAATTRAVLVVSHGWPPFVRANVTEAAASPGVTIKAYWER